MARKHNKQPAVFSFLRKKKHYNNFNGVIIEDDRWLEKIKYIAQKKNKKYLSIGLPIIFICWVPLLFGLPFWIVPIIFVIGMAFIYISGIPEKEIRILIDLYKEETLHSKIIIGELTTDDLIVNYIKPLTSEWIISYKKHNKLSDKLKYNIICKYNNKNNQLIFMRQGVLIKINKEVEILKYNYDNIYDLLDQVAIIINKICRDSV